MAVLLRVLALAAALLAQDPSFESADFGIRLKLPAGWNVDAARDARAVLKLNLPGEFPVRPELVVYEVPLPEAVTLSQYKEPYRQLLQRSFKDVRLEDDRAVTAGGKTGFRFVLRLKDAGDVDMVLVKSLFEISPRRFLAVDATYPKSAEEKVGGAHEALMKSLEFIPRRPAPDVAEGVKQWAALRAKLPPAAVEAGEELEVLYGDKVIGTYTYSFKPGARGAQKGLETRIATRLDLGADGRIETETVGFLADDGSLQVAELTELKVGKDKRTQDYTARSVLAGRALKVERRINGEHQVFESELPENSVLAELVEPLQFRLLEFPKGQVAVPVIGAFDADPAHHVVAQGGLNQMKSGDSTVDVYVVFAVRDNGPQMTYWYDKDRRLIRITTQGQSLVIRRKK